MAHHTRRGYVRVLGDAVTRPGAEPLAPRGLETDSQPSENGLDADPPARDVTTSGLSIGFGDDRHEVGLVGTVRCRAVSALDTANRDC